ncbi:MAG: heme exporter protein CcmD [Rubrivivax sp.]
MNWSSFGEFAAMGGYGLYVWGSVGMCALVLTGEMLSLRMRRRALLELPFEGADDPATGVRP